MAPDLVEAFVGEFNAEVNRQARRPLRGRVDREKPLAKVCCRIDDLVEAVADGRRFPTLREQLECLEDEKVSLAAALAADAPPVQRLPQAPATSTAT